MPNYTRKGKVLIPLSDEQFSKAMSEGHFCRKKHRGFLALLYHTGVRVSEALRAHKEQFTIKNNAIYFDVLKRLKHGLHTAPLKIDLDYPYSLELWEAIEETKPKKRVFPYCRMTGYLIVQRAIGTYPHHLRLSKITNLLMPKGKRRGYSIPKVRSWTGLSLGALNFYVGMVDIEEMGTLKQSK